MRLRRRILRSLGAGQAEEELELDHGEQGPDAGLRQERRLGAEPHGARMKCAITGLPKVGSEPQLVDVSGWEMAPLPGRQHSAAR